MNTKKLYYWSITVALAGFLFGFDTIVISGAEQDIQRLWGSYTLFGSNDLFHGIVIVGAALWGTVLGAIFGAIPNDRLGRKKTLVFIGVLYTISAIGSSMASDPWIFALFRFIGGIGVGASTIAAPSFISEIAPQEKRGRLVATYQFNIVFGILIAFVSNALLAKYISNDAWRWMIGIEALPAIIYTVMMFAIPESPRWLTLKGKEVKARYVLTRVNGSAKAKEEIANIKSTIGGKSETLKAMAKKGYLFPLIIGAALALLTQLSGINAIIYYGPSILNEAGFQLSDALGGQVIIGITNVVFTLIAIWKIDQIGRRPLLIFGVSGILIFLTIIGFLFFFGVDSGIILLIFILLFIACFAFSYGPVIWVLLAEIYPTRYRGRAMAVATLTRWVGNTFIGQMTPWFLENLKPHGTFWLFALMTLPALYISIKLLPETKGKSLEEIEQYWISRKNKKA